MDGWMDEWMSGWVSELHHAVRAMWWLWWPCPSMFPSWEPRWATGNWDGADHVAATTTPSLDLHPTPSTLHRVGFSSLWLCGREAAAIRGTGGFCLISSVTSSVSCRLRELSRAFRRRRGRDAGDVYMPHFWSTLTVLWAVQESWQLFVFSSVQQASWVCPRKEDVIWYWYGCDSSASSGICCDAGFSFQWIWICIIRFDWIGVENNKWPIVVQQQHLKKYFMDVASCKENFRGEEVKESLQNWIYSFSSLSVLHLRS